MKKLAVIGHPVAQSLSPLIHNHWIAEYGYDAQYEAVDIAPENLHDQIRSMIDDDYIGFNVTIPHKMAVMDLCDMVDDTARRIGAVNMMAVNDAGQLCGFNTDVFGFIQNIRDQQPDFDFTSGGAVVLGAGGAARAVVAGLLDAGVPGITITNRTRSKAEDIAADFGIGVTDWEDRSEALPNAALLVNTTSLGMTGQPSLDMDLMSLPQHALVTDIVYKPLMTDLLLMASSRDHKIVTGLGMLLQQARPSFAKWFGVMPEIDEKLQQKITENISI